MGNCISFDRPRSSILQRNQAPDLSTNLLPQQQPILSSSSVQFTINHQNNNGIGTPSSSGVSSASSSTTSAIVSKPVNDNNNNSRFQYVVIFDYDARANDDLTIRKSDLLEITYKKSTTWWKAKNENGQEGWIPSNYVAKRDSLESEPFVFYILN
jgi:hypothetical protein